MTTKILITLWDKIQSFQKLQGNPTDYESKAKNR